MARLYLDREPAQRHHQRGGVLHRASGRRWTRCSRPPTALGHAPGRRQGADGPPRPRRRCRDSAQSGYDDSAALIARWHGKGRLGYAITPRFARHQHAGATGCRRCAVARTSATATCSRTWPRTAPRWPGCASCFPEARDYLDVYERHGLVGPRAIYAHGIHLDEREFARCHESDTALAHCPTSNLFLGSGLFDLAAATRVDRPRARGPGHRPRCRHQLLDAAHHGRGRQGRAAARHAAVARARLLPGHARRRPRAAPGRSHRQHRRRAWRPTWSCSTCSPRR